MVSVTQTYFRLADASEALGVSANTLRDWVQREKVELLADEATPWTTQGKARLCNAFGMLRLIVVAKLNAYGVGFPQAKDAADQVIARARKIWAGEQKRLSVSALLSHMTGWVLIVEARPEGHSVTFGNDLRGQVANNLSHFALVRLGQVAATTFNRLLPDGGEAFGEQ